MRVARSIAAVAAAGALVLGVPVGIAAAEPVVPAAAEDAHILPGGPPSGAKPGGPEDRRAGDQDLPVCDDARSQRGQLFGPSGRRALDWDLDAGSASGSNRYQHRSQCIEDPPAPVDPGRPPETTPGHGGAGARPGGDGSAGGVEAAPPRDDEAGAQSDSGHAGAGGIGPQDGTAGEGSGDGTARPGDADAGGNADEGSDNDRNGADARDGGGTSQGLPPASTARSAGGHDPATELGVATTAGSDSDGGMGLGGGLLLVGGGGVVAAAAVVWLAARARRG